MDGGLAARRFSKKIYDPGKNPRKDFFRASSGNVLFTYLPKSIKPWRAAWRMQNRVAILQSSGKSMEGFSGGDLRGIGGAAEAVP